ncbi:MAG: DUF4350 domain-containing protein [Thermoplasmata archaeon]
MGMRDRMKTVYFDETHEETSKISGEEHYGHSKLAKMLRENGYKVKKLSSYEEIVIENENVCEGILVISFPMKEFSYEEIKKIHNFVERGGGLLVLGEWGKVTKPIKAINSITGSFGIRFNNDIVLDDKNNFKPSELPESVIKDVSMLPKYIRVCKFEKHEINFGIKEIGYFSGCTLTHMIGAGQASVLFRSSESSTREVFEDGKSRIEKDGNYALGYALERGKGRIVCIGDHSLFTNAFIKIRDNEKFALNVVSWLGNCMPEKEKIKDKVSIDVENEEERIERSGEKKKETKVQQAQKSEVCEIRKGITTVVFDEGHGETSKIEDGEPFGYYRLAWYLKKKGYKVENFTGSDIRELLSKKKDIVLVVSFPFRRFSEEEVESIKEFVKEGGGLWLLGEWDSKIGRRNAVNSISRSFGVEFNIDTVVDYENVVGPDEKGQEVSLDMPADTIERARYVKINILRRHGITKGIKELHYMAGCSLSFKPGSGVVAMGLSSDTSFADLDGDAKLDDDEYKDNLCVFAIQEYGKGRVAYLGDHGLIMNNAIGRADNREFGYNVIRWLGKDIEEGVPIKSKK